MRSRLAILAVFALAGCASAPPRAADASLPTASVPAAGETAAVASAQDAADDPAIWRNAADPAGSLIVATDKKAGLYVYGLDGRVRSQFAAGRVNNVDLRDGVTIGGARGVLVGASDRNDVANGKIALFRLDTASGALAPLGVLPAVAGEAYGFCLWKRASDQALFAFLVMKDGTIAQAKLDVGGPAPKLEIVRTVKLATQSEGCVADDRTGALFVAEEDVGVWRLDADPASKVAPKMFAPVDGKRLFADAEGVALAKRGRQGGALIVSSQGDSAYAAYRLADGRFLGRFRIVQGPTGVGATSETDGIEVSLENFGPAYPQGIMLAQDGDNAPSAQNFKMVDWRAVRKALGL